MDPGPQEQGFDSEAFLFLELVRTQADGAEHAPERTSVFPDDLPV